MEPITDLAQKWLNLDRDPVTRKEIEELMQQNDTASLEQLLRHRIAFGTAGLRARMQAGFARMNSLIVIQASQGLAEYILAQIPGAKEKGVVIGCDARFNSAKFAALTASAFISRDIQVWKFSGAVHTPLVPYSVSRLKAAAGVMVTASHNPASDNGYKVYWQNGCQIIPPHDSGIAAAIEQNLNPVSWDATLHETETGFVRNAKLFESAAEAYFQQVTKVSLAEDALTVPRFVYTPMHGVGYVAMSKVVQFLVQELKQRGCTPQRFPMEVVQEQVDPDPTFPTVAFPNPEEAGALNLAMQTAEKHSISLILATDPDADRLAVAEKLASTNRWHQFTGNQIGVLLASYVLSAPEYSSLQARGSMAMLCSTVSTGMLRRMAEIEGFHFVETLTGFKWLGNVAQQIRSTRGFTVPYAFEEAIGYMFTKVGYDKDGIIAAAMFLAATEKWQRQEGVTPWEKLQQLYKKYGYFADANTYLISPSSNVTEAVFTHIRNAATAAGQRYPKHVGKFAITRVRDLTLGYDSGTPENVPELPVDPTSQMITCELQGGVRFTVRASGTEPKIKFYVEAIGSTEDEASRLSKEVRDVVISSWFGDPKYGLKGA